MTTVTGTARLSLSPGLVPVTRTGHSITVRARKTNAGHTAALGINLFENHLGNSIQRTGVELTQSLTAVLADYTLAITNGDAATLTSYDDLELRIRGFSTTNDLATFEVAKISLNIPVSGGFTVASVVQSLVAAAGDSQVTLTWTAPASNGGSAITSYRIYRGTSPNGETLLADPIGTGTTYVDNTAVNGTAYYYRVSAFNSVGENTWSSEATATPSVAAAPVAIRTFKRFYGPTQLGNTPSTLYTCPPSAIAVIRHIHVSNPSGAPVDFSLSIGTSAAGTRLWDAIPVAATDVLDHYQDHTLIEGEIIQGFAGSAATLNLTVDGYEVANNLPADPNVYPSDTLFPHD